MTEPRAEREMHTARGVLVALVLAVPLLVGAWLVVTAALGVLIAGWTPSTMFSGNAMDWLVGGGAEGDAANYVRFMLGAVLAGGSWTAIRWAFFGSD